MKTPIGKILHHRSFKWLWWLIPTLALQALLLLWHEEKSVASRAGDLRENVTNLAMEGDNE